MVQGSTPSRRIAARIFQMYRPRVGGASEPCPCRPSLWLRKASASRYHRRARVIHRSSQLERAVFSGSGLLRGRRGARACLRVGGTFRAGGRARCGPLAGWVPRRSSRQRRRDQRGCTAIRCGRIRGAARCRRNPAHDDARRFSAFRDGRPHWRWFRQRRSSGFRRAHRRERAPGGFGRCARNVGNGRNAELGERWWRDERARRLHVQRKDVQRRVRAAIAEGRLRDDRL
jgi:hypothetical protein